jgi:formamidopyrimidine-DNA glycosylase
MVGQRIALLGIGRHDIIGTPGNLRARRGTGSSTHADGALRRALLHGATVSSLVRHGKQMAIVADDGRVLVVHLGMSGRLVTADNRDREVPPHTHARWSIGSARELRFTDPRRFGALVPCAGDTELQSHWAGLGPDAMDISAEQLGHALASRRTPVKVALLDQQTVAGLGNIYVDETLHRAGIHPLMRSTRASTYAEAIWTSMRGILEAAIAAGGSTLRDYVDGSGNPGAYATLHRVYGRSGKQCHQCGTHIRSMVVGGRTTAFCPGCQGRVRPAL